MNTVSCKCRGL